MEHRDFLVSALSQMIAPRLFVLSGDNPAEMGFPFADDEPAFKERLARQFDPISFWSAKAKEIAEAVVDTIESGGKLDSFDVDAIIKKSADYAQKWQPSAAAA